MGPCAEEVKGEGDYLEELEERVCKGGGLQQAEAQSCIQWG